MSIESFCIFADISTETFRNYESKDEIYKDFFEVTTRIRAIIESQQFEGATVGAFNPNIIARKLGLQDNVKQEFSGEVKTSPNIKVTIVKSNPDDD